MIVGSIPPIVLAAFLGISVVSYADAQGAKDSVAGERRSSTPPEPAITNSIGLRLVLIPAGEFMTGSSESAEAMAAFLTKQCGRKVWPDCFADEHPQHRVRITHAFYLGMYHVTRGQFRKFVAATGYKTDAEDTANGYPPVGWNAVTKRWQVNDGYNWRNAGFEQTDEHPVVNVAWRDAVAFCKWLSRKEGRTYRLPTEAEWEYACRAGTITRYYCGDDPRTLATVGNLYDETAAASVKHEEWCQIRAKDGYVFTAPVGRFRPNAFGLYDMHGNANQWCADWYGPKYYAESTLADPNGPASGELRVCRGSAWNAGPRFARSANRSTNVPDFRSDNTTGFRVARMP